MRKHFVALVIGSLLFLIRVISMTWTRTVGGSDPAAVAAMNSAIVIELLGLFGMYAVFVVLILGHGLLLPRTDQSHPVREADGDD